MHKEGVFSALVARSVCCGEGAGYEYFHSHDVMCNCGPLQRGKAHAVLCERVKPVWSFVTVRHVVICDSMACCRFVTLRHVVICVASYRLNPSINIDTATNCLNVHTYTCVGTASDGFSNSYYSWVLLNLRVAHSKLM